MRTLLITSVGSLVGYSILEALVPRRIEWRIVGVNSVALAANNFCCDVAYLVPETSQEEAFLSSLREIILRENPVVVIAGRDQDLWPIARLKEESEFKKTLFLSPSAACVRVVNDKYATWLFSQENGLSFAKTAHDGPELEELIGQVGFPLICKPRFGNASRGVFIVGQKGEADAALAKGGFVFQEYLSPPWNLGAIIPDFRFGIPLFYGIAEEDHYSAQGLVDKDGELLAFFATINILEGGKAISLKPLKEPALERLTAAYARALGPLGYIGPINLNCKKIGPGQFVPYELNGRFTGSSAARAALGFNEVIYALDYFLDGRRPKPINGLRDENHALRSIVQRIPGTHLLDLAEVAGLTSTGVWRRES